MKGIVGASDSTWDQFENEDGELSGEAEAAPLGPDDGFVKL